MPTTMIAATAAAILVCVLAVFVPATSATGDLRTCLDSLRSSSSGGSLGGTHRLMGKMEVLPGSGWDNLQNADMGAVLSLNYSHCHTTDDGRFLIPDVVNVYPVKTSRVDSFAEIIDSWKEYKSTTSHGINADAGFKFAGIFGISGSYANDYVHSKTRQLEDNTMTTRVQERYVRYRIVLQPDMPLDPGFKFRLLSIAASLELNDTYAARFDAQQLVREFGTHVTTSVDAGAAIVQEEQVSQDFKKVTGYTKAGLRTAAKFSFASQVGLFWGGVSYESSTQTAFNKLYMQNRTESVVRAIGGSIVNMTNYTREHWTDTIDKDLVAIDRAGEPIYNFITAQTLPEIPASTLLQLTSVVEEAVRAYYRMNTYLGCTDQTMENFSPKANVDDGSCQPPDLSKLRLGGVYQKCTNQRTDAGDLCAGLSLNNPSTGQPSCPDGFEAVLLFNGSKTQNAIAHKCHSCWIFGHCCHDETVTSSATYGAYWCAALQDPENEQQTADGYMFGGVYSSHVANPVTASMDCPHAFIPFKVGEDMHVCLSDQYSTAVENEVPFGGFFSCKAGNPFALRTPTNGTNSTTGIATSRSGLSLHMYTKGPEFWPRKCPIGYSPFMAEINTQDGCEIDFCIKAGSLKPKKIPSLRRPPFIRPPVRQPNPMNQFVFDISQNLWQKNEMVHNNTSGSSHWSKQTNMATLLGYGWSGDLPLLHFISNLILIGVVLVLAMMVAVLTVRIKALTHRQCRNKYQGGQ